MRITTIFAQQPPTSMKDLLSNISINACPSTYLKNPQSSDLGQRIVSESVEMISEIGFEAFTFRKLGSRLGTSEASIYRYFESKHKILLYLTSWYWSWMEYRLVFSISNIENPAERLSIAIELLTQRVNEHFKISHVDENKLFKIVVAESAKAYLSKDVDEANDKGVFASYQKLVGRVSDIVREIRPDYKYPRMLVSSVIVGSHHQRFFAEHIPGLTDVVTGEDSISEYYKQTAFSAINASSNG